MKKLIAFAVLALAFCLPSYAQTTKTVNFTIQPGSCQTTVVAPRYYCMGYMTSPNSVDPSSTDEWSIYVDQVQSDGSFAAGFLNLYAAFDDETPVTAEDMTYFTSNAISGVEANGYINGTASGTLSGKHTGTFTASFVNFKIGTVRRCAGRYGCRTVPAIVSGSINVTAQVN